VASLRRLGLAAAALAVAATGCGGGGGRSPEDVVRAWSRALNANDNRAAAALFATDAHIVQSGETIFHSRADAVEWNASLPCAGKLEDVSVQGDDVTATFLLDERPHHVCDSPGGHAGVIFRIRDGKIVLWHELVEQDTGQTA
jgi:ketosteroid isomerase-like protein